MSEPFNTVQLYLSIDGPGNERVIRCWFEQGWAQLGRELRDWFSAEASRQALRPSLPEGARLTLLWSDEGPTTADGDGWTDSTSFDDIDLDPTQWEQFLSAVGAAGSAVLGAGQLVRSGGQLWRGNADQVTRAIDFSCQRYGDTRVVRCLARWEFLLSPERQNTTVAFLREIADLAGPSYGEIAHSATGLDYTAFEYAIGLSGATPVPEVLSSARAALRGYGWVTIVPKELAGLLGTVYDIIDTGAFVDVYRLNNGGLWLQATHLFTEYDRDAARKVSHALAPILRPGTPVPSLALQSKV